MIFRVCQCFVIYLSSLLLLVGCSAMSGPDLILVSEGATENVCRVVVFPFVNESKDLGISQLSSRIFRNELVSSGLFIVSSEGAIRNFMTQKKLFLADLRETRTRLYKELGENLQVDAVVRGTVMKSGMVDLGQDGDVPFVGLKIEIIDVQTGKLLVDTFHQRRGDDYRKIMHVGLVKTKTGLMAKVTEEIIQTWKSKGVSSCQI